MNPEYPKVFYDQMGREILLNSLPKRIISLVPSQTELLYDLGLEEEVVGQTLFCIHPNHMHLTKPRIGGTKKLNIEKIKALKPDLIIGNKEENRKEDIELIEKEFPVWLSDIQNLDQALEMIGEIGLITGKQPESLKLINRIKTSFPPLVQTKPLKTCIYLIWHEPMMLAGGNTFIDSMLQQKGLENLALNKEGRYPEISADWIKQLNPEYILLSSEPFPFGPKHLEYYQNQFPKSKVLLVDGELFSWYGSRLLKSAEYFHQLNV